jgi:thioredoxin 1
MSEAAKRLPAGELDQLLTAAKEKNDNSVMLVDFFADWCHFCQIAAPAIEELARNYRDVKFLKVDVDEDGEAASKYNAQSIPTVIIFKNGQEVDRVVGFPGKQAYEGMIKLATEDK